MRHHPHRLQHQPEYQPPRHLLDLQAVEDAPHGLGFLEPALAELIDEAETLQTNVEGLRGLDRSLAVFNESFASYLYVMNMHALTTDWAQVRG